MRFEGEYFYLFVFSFLFVLCDCVVCHISHPTFIVKFTYHIGDNVKFKCGGENWVRSSKKVSNFSKFCQVLVANPSGHPASVRTPISLGGKIV